MSRIGKKPINVPQNVTVEINDGNVLVKGPKGELKTHIRDFVKLIRNENIITVEPIVDRKNKQIISAYWGLARKTIQNMIDGVTKGFEKKLNIEGIGYKAQVQGNKLIMSLGYSHPVEMEIPNDLKVAVTDSVNISVNGASIYKVGQYAALIRGQRKPEPYKGKGVKYATEKIKIKVGKSGV